MDKTEQELAERKLVERLQWSAPYKLGERMGGGSALALWNVTLSLLQENAKQDARIKELELIIAGLQDVIAGRVQPFSEIEGKAKGGSQ